MPDQTFVAPMQNSLQRTSSYVEYLPAILQADPFIGQFLQTFERSLSGLSSQSADDPYPQQSSLEGYIDNLYTYFQPVSHHPQKRTPSEFLPWLASWVALSLRDDWSDDFRRNFISQIVPLYKLRGTKTGLKKILELYTQENVSIYEFDEPAHYFQVEMTISVLDRSARLQTLQIARAILEQEKPAHTFYSLQILIPSLQIRNDVNPDQGIGIQVGVNTLLGTHQINN